VRKALVDLDYVDCVVQLTNQLFANTQIPCSLWFLSKSRQGGNGYRKRTGEVLFIDGRKLGTLIPGSRKQKELSSGELEQIASAYRRFKRKDSPEDVAGFCRTVTLGEIGAHHYALTPGRYVGSQDLDDFDEPIEERLPKLVADVERLLTRSEELASKVVSELHRLGR
jgi:type I restriction enzyme M protein